MLRCLWATFVAVGVCTAAHGQTTAGQAAAQGKQTGTAAIQPTKQGINTGSGQANVPGYNNNAVEGQYFQGGNGNLAGPSTQRLTDCQSSTSPDCAAVNFLRNKSSAVNPISINSNDPLIQANRDRTNDPGSVLGGMMTSFPAKSTSNCAAAAPGPATPQQVIEVCASYSMPASNTCERNWILEVDRWWSYRCQSSGTVNLLCHTNTMATCSIDGKALSSYSAAKAGAFVSAAITPTATPGLYQYVLQVPVNNCGGDGAASVSFSLDTVGQGGYITMNMTSLDDAAAVAVNNYTVYAGYPNHGPSYDSGFFPQTAAAFQVGYSWSEDIGKDVCLAYDYNGSCYQWQYQPNVLTFTANTKLLDFCPAGYAPIEMRSFNYCDSYLGCFTANPYTPYNVTGFFCNSEGKFLMNRSEGKGNGTVTSSATMPLLVGTNRIDAYWGTWMSSKACGNLTVTGQIYNVGPVCNTTSQTICEKP